MRVLSSVPEHRAWPRPLAATGLFLAAIIAGGATGTWWPDIADRLGGAVDHLVMLLVAVIFFTLPSGGLLDRRRVPRIAFLAVAMNFLLIPVVAFALTSVLIPDDALRVGILIYCLAPVPTGFWGSPAWPEETPRPGRRSSPSSSSCSWRSTRCGWGCSPDTRS